MNAIIGIIVVVSVLQWGIVLWCLLRYGTRATLFLLSTFFQVLGHCHAEFWWLWRPMKQQALDAAGWHEPALSERRAEG